MPAMHNKKKLSKETAVVVSFADASSTHSSQHFGADACTSKYVLTQRHAKWIVINSLTRLVKPQDNMTNIIRQSQNMRKIELADAH